MTATSEPTYDELSEAERSWIDAQLVAAADAGAEPSEPASVARLFDEALAVREGSAGPETGNAVVTQVGVLVGEHLCRSAGLRWAILTDEHGTDLCVRLPGSSLVLFPLSSAAKRWESGETAWVQPFCAWAHERVAELTRTGTL